jgi:hypothetical protein
MRRLASTVACTLLLGSALTGCLTLQAAPKAEEPTETPTPSQTASETPTEATEPVVEESPSETVEPAFTVSGATTCSELITVGRGKSLVERSLAWITKDTYTWRDSDKNYKIVQELNDVAAHAKPKFQPYIAIMVDLMDEMRHDIDRNESKTYDLGDYRAAALELANICMRTPGF